MRESVFEIIITIADVEHKYVKCALNKHHAICLAQNELIQSGNDSGGHTLGFINVNKIG